MAHDIVYICRDGKNEELRYSLRSIERNFPHRLVIIYGDKPDDIEPDVKFMGRRRSATIGTFVSTADESWKNELIGHAIREKFKDPSIWEVSRG